MAALARVDGISERTLARLIKWAAIALVLLLVAFGVLYVLGQRVDAGPSLSERQITTAEDAVRATPLKVSARLQLATTYQQAGRLEDALAQYNEVIKAVPGNRTALLGQGNVYLAQGNIDEARKSFAAVTKGSQSAEFSNIDPQVEAAHYFLGSIAASKGEFPAAEKELAAALKMDGADADAWYLQGTVHTALGKNEEAITDLRKALLMVPTGWCEPYTAMQAAYQKLSLPAQAEYAGAMVDFCQKRPADATSRLTALTSGPVAIDAMLGLGLIAESTSDRDGATAWYTKVLAASPGNATATSAIARLSTTEHAATTAGDTTTKSGA